MRGTREGKQRKEEREGKRKEERISKEEYLDLVAAVAVVVVHSFVSWWCDGQVQCCVSSSIITCY